MTEVTHLHARESHANCRSPTPNSRGGSPWESGKFVASEAGVGATFPIPKANPPASSPQFLSADPILLLTQSASGVSARQLL